MKLTIITPDSVVYEGSFTAITVPGTSGSFQILRDHAAIVSTLQDGEVIIENGKEKEKIIIKGGVVETKDNTVTLLAEGIVKE